MPPETQWREDLELLRTVALTLVRVEKEETVPFVVAAFVGTITCIQVVASPIRLTQAISTSTSIPSQSVYMA